MNIKPVASRADIQTPISNSISRSPAREKAIATLMGISSPSESESPVNQNNVAPEDMSAVSPQPPTPQEAQPGQPDNSVESSDPVPEKTPGSEDPLSKQYAMLAKRERALRAKQQQHEQALSAREQELKAKEAALAAKEQEYQRGYISKDRLKQQPLQALAEAELSYDDITQQLINQQPTDPRMEAHIQRLEAKIKEMEAATDGFKKDQQTQQEQQYQAAIKQLETDATNLLKNDPAFETAHATNSAKDVVELIRQTYDKEGILLSVEEAAQMVEDYLVEQAMKITKIEKIKKQLNLAGQPVKQPEAPQIQASSPQQKQTQMKTLTNATGATRKLSSRERAILAFKGEKPT